MRTRLTVSCFSTITAPVVTVGVRHLSGTGEFRTLYGMADVPHLPRTLRPIGGGAVILGSQRIGKQHSFQIANADPVFLEVSLSKVGGGFKAMTRKLYVRAAHDTPYAEMSVKAGMGVVTALAGPLEILTSAEAKEAFGRNFKDALLLDVQRDARALGMEWQGERRETAVRNVQTIDEHGLPTTVAIRRRKRILEL